MSDAPLVYPRSIPTQVPGNDQISASIRDADSFGTKVVDYLVIKVYSSDRGNPYKHIGGGGSNEGALYKTIYLYLPQGLKEEYGAEYARTTLGAAGLGVMNMVKQGMGTSAADKGNLQGNLVQQLQQTAGAAKPEFIMNAVGSAIGTVNSGLGLQADGLDANSIAALTTKKIFNPYQETTFRGTSYRSHNFNFKCAPKNRQEASELYRIVHILRKAMLPGTNDGTPEELQWGDDPAASANPGAEPAINDTAANILGSQSGGGSNRFLTIPDYFRLSIARVEGKVNEDGDLDLMAGQPARLARIMQFPVKCVLTNLSMDLTPDGPYNSLKDEFDSATDYGPAAFNLNLNFDETAFLTKNEIR